ncbi:unnamed protein product [Parnassius apollo]|uniref:(apollo) hypothetical protein n=1 Tax=Parnassius apollo TaxID=110799 RepID=A0A8S3XJM5_PARAO|nr:unnamed protein product [Parnassius apollo]
MESVKECAACLSNSKDVPVLLCSRCAANYHLLCMNISSKDYKKMSQEDKSNWICVQCRCKERKGDNTNTPVRSNPPPSPKPDYVTKRGKTRTTGTNCSCLSASSIRDIIREELQQLFNHQIHPHLLEVQNAVSSLEASMAHFNEELEKNQG